MEDYKISGQTLDEITNRYFDSTYFRESYTIEERSLLKQGFKEGLEYMYPMFESKDRLIKVYEKLERLRDSQES